MTKHYYVIIRIIWYYYINFADDKTNKKSDARVRTATIIMVIMPNEHNTCVVLPTYDLCSYNKI